MNLTRALLCGSALLCASLGSRQSLAEYLTQPGDVIEIDVAGLPEMRQRTPVQQDGTISYPLLGVVSVAGLSASQLQAKIADGLADKIYRRWTSDGREIDILVRPDEVAASVVEYPPVYVGGNVAKPGEVAFQPGMTVRAALALTGGLSLLDGRSPDLVLQAASLRGDDALYWLDFVKAQARMARVTSELAGQDKFAAPASIEAPVAPAQIKQIYQLEAESLKARMIAYRDQTASLQSAVKQVDDQITVVTKLQQVDEQGAAADQQDLQKQLQLFSRGMLTSTQVNEARRALLYSSTRTLQATTQLLLLQRQRQDAVQQLQNFDDQRRISLLKELQEAALALNEARAKTTTVQDSLEDISTARGQIAAPATVDPAISIIRAEGQKRAKISAHLDDPLEPGDLVDVELRPDEGSQAAIR